MHASPNHGPQRNVPGEVEDAAKKLHLLLEGEFGLPEFDIGFFRDKDGAGVGVRFHGDLPEGFEVPEEIDGIRIKQR